MTKEKLSKLVKYVKDLTERLNSELPTKHKDRGDTFKAFLRKEIASTGRTIEAAKMELK